MSKKELSEADKQDIRWYVHEVKDAEERKKRRLECAERYGVSWQVVAGITATDRDDVGGFEFDNEIKNKWREEVMNILTPMLQDASFFQKPVDQITVCGMFGIRCLDVPGFLAAGINPKNIDAVEINNKWKFRMNCKHYGVKCCPIDIRKAVKEKPYDVVYLDFTSPYCKLVQETLVNMHKAPKVLLINYLGQREHEKNKTVFAEHTAWFLEHLKKARLLRKEELTIQEQRELIVPLIFASNFTTVFSDTIYERLAKFEIKMAIIWANLSKHFATERDIYAIELFLAYCCDQVTTLTPLIKRWERLGYTSTAGAVYLTEIFFTHFPNIEWMRPIVNMFDQEELFTIRRHKSREILPRNVKIGWKDTIGFFSMRDVERWSARAKQNADAFIELLNGGQPPPRKWLN